VIALPPLEAAYHETLAAPDPGVALMVTTAGYVEFPHEGFGVVTDGEPGNVFTVAITEGLVAVDSQSVVVL
jgi:hypothetical protein